MTPPASSRSMSSSCSRGCRQSGSCSPPIRHMACPPPPSTWSCAWRGTRSWMRRRRERCWAARWRGSSMASRCPRSRPRAVRIGSRCREGLRAYTATPASSARPCSPVRASRRARCWTWRWRRAATPSRGRSGRRSTRSARRSPQPMACSTTRKVSVRRSTWCIARSCARPPRYPTGPVRGRSGSA